MAGPEDLDDHLSAKRINGEEAASERPPSDLSEQQILVQPQSVGLAGLEQAQTEFGQVAVEDQPAAKLVRISRVLPFLVKPAGIDGIQLGGGEQPAALQGLRKLRNRERHQEIPG